MRLTVAGCAASYPGPGQACSAYLVESGETRVLLDCGNGSLAQLSHVTDPLTLDAVFVTHRHPDHFVDLFALQAAIRYAPEGPLPVGPMPLYGPAGLYESMECLLDTRSRDELEAAFTCELLDAGRDVKVGALTVTPLPVEHINATYALRVSDGNGGTLLYTSDSRLGAPLREAAAGASVLLAEATLPQEYAGRVPHMTAEEAGRLAAESGAHTLVLTHVWPTADRDAMLAEARAVFGGEVLMASELMTVEVA